MAILNPYLTFLGNCEEAFDFYKSVFGGDFTHISRFSQMPEQKDIIMSEDEQNKIMHIALPISKETVLMGADAGGHRDANMHFGNNISLSLIAESKEKADELFGKLSENGEATMPMQKVSWGDYFGMCKDQFGINWMISFNRQQQ